MMFYSDPFAEFLGKIKPWKDPWPPYILSLDKGIDDDTREGDTNNSGDNRNVLQIDDKT